MLLSSAQVPGPVRHRFGQVDLANCVAVREIGHGAGHAQQTVVAAPGEAKLPGRRLREGERTRRQLGVPAQKLAREVGVARSLPGKHPLAGGGDARTHGGGGFRLGRASEFFHRQAGDAHHRVDAVKQGPAQARGVAGAFGGGAGAGLLGVRKITALAPVRSTIQS